MTGLPQQYSKMEVQPGCLCHVLENSIFKTPILAFAEMQTPRAPQHTTDLPPPFIFVKESERDYRHHLTETCG